MPQKCKMPQGQGLFVLKIRGPSLSMTSMCNNESFAADSGLEICMGGAIFRPSESET